MKKHGLLKILGILLLLVVIVSFVLTGRSETKDLHLKNMQQEQRQQLCI